MGARSSKNKSDAQSPKVVASPTALAGLANVLPPDLRHVLPPDLRASYTALSELSAGFQELPGIGPRAPRIYHISSLRPDNPVPAPFPAGV